MPIPLITSCVGLIFITILVSLWLLLVGVCSCKGMVKVLHCGVASVGVVAFSACSQILCNVRPSCISWLEESGCVNDEVNNLLYKSFKAVYSYCLASFESDQLYSKLDFDLNNVYELCKLARYFTLNLIHNYHH